MKILAVNYPKYRIGFNERKQQRVKPMDKNNQEQITALTDKLCSVLLSRANNEVPYQGKFAKLSVSYKIPNTSNKFMVVIEHDEVSPENLRRISIGAHHENSDMTIKEYIFKGRREEVLDFLTKDEAKQQFLSGAIRLSGEVDKYYQEHPLI